MGRQHSCGSGAAPNQALYRTHRWENVNSRLIHPASIRDTLGDAQQVAIGDLEAALCTRLSIGPSTQDMLKPTVHLEAKGWAGDSRMVRRLALVVCAGTT